MTRIDFYSGSESKLLLACRLTANAVRQKASVVVYAPDESAARDFDRLLWTYQAVGFVPHCTSRHALAAESPVVIADDDAAAPHYHVILNLHFDSPPSFSRFERLIELVGDDEQDRERARARYRFYRERGYDIAHHELPAA